MTKKFIILSSLLLSITVLMAQSKIFSYGFEHDDVFGIWKNINARFDTTAYEGCFVNHISPSDEFGLKIVIGPAGEFAGQNIHIDYEAMFRFNDSDAAGSVVISIQNNNGNTYWHNYPLEGERGKWSKNGFSTTIPADYIMPNADINIYVWNNAQRNIDIDAAKIDIDAAPLPRYLPKPHETLLLGHGSKLTQGKCHRVKYFAKKKSFALTDDDGTPLTKGIYTVTEAIISNDTMVFVGDIWQIDKEGGLVCNTPIGSTKVTLTDKNNNGTLISTESRFNLDMKIIRQALVIPFVEEEMEIYRQNCTTDTIMFQECYYLADRGFSIGRGSRSVNIYHAEGVSSLQLDAAHKTAYFNADFWRDHPLIHYPLNNDTIDYFIDTSCRNVDESSVINSQIELTIGSGARLLPVFMPTYDGYDAALVFTEHADWSDIRTHRAVLFGNENITQADSAIGGFVYYGVPVTKSVFYNNPDNITNEEKSNGIFKGKQASLMEDIEFLNTIKQLNDIGFDICLHTPEQYTTTKDNMDEALKFMHEQFNSTSWIDHGYNNTSIHNREDLVCDGLIDTSLWYSLPLWQQYGIRYVWNAYYEENPLWQYNFDCNIMQPYPGFGDALPHPMITSLPNGDTTLLLWATPATFETSSDGGWNYFYSKERLNRFANNNDIHITHIYPAWVIQERSFWEYDADSTIIARKGFNNALRLISEMREQKRINTTTVTAQLRYYEAIKKINYDIIDGNSICLTNTGNTIKGITMLFHEMPDFGDKEINTRQSDKGIVVWFNLDKEEKITIKYRQ